MLLTLCIMLGYFFQQYFSICLLTTKSKVRNVIDGTGRPAVLRDIAVKGDVIVKTRCLDSFEAREIVDASGLIVCPGFIDIHSHSDFNIFVDPPAQSKIQQGVTTEVCGNCGMSAAPLQGIVKKHRES